MAEHGNLNGIIHTWQYSPGTGTVFSFLFFFLFIKGKRRVRSRDGGRDRKGEANGRKGKKEEE